MISQERMEKALRYLAETDEPYAVEKADVERTEILRKRVRSRAFIEESGTVAERQAKADIHADTLKADDEYIASMVAMEKLKAKRETEAKVIEVWRSLESSRRQGA